jgi:hypothetical protein
MTEQRLDRPNAAQKSLARANEWAEMVLNGQAGSVSWNRQLTLELLRKEAEELIGPIEKESEKRLLERNCYTE